MKIFYLLLFLNLLRTEYHVVSQDTLFISDDIQLIRISERSYVHVSWMESKQWGRFSSNGFLLVNGHEAFLFDTPMTDDLTEKLIRFIHDSLRISIKGFIPNHWHDDCMGGIATVHRFGIKSYGYELTCAIAKEKKLPVPQISIPDSFMINLEGMPVECRYFGAGHSMDNIVCWFPSENILFGGCLVKEMKANHPGNYADGDLHAWPGTIEKIMKAYPDNILIIPGHGTPGGRRLLDHTIEILRKNTEK